MDTNQIAEYINNLTVGTTTSTPWVTLAVAAFIAGFVVTVTPTPLRPLAFLYVGLMALCLYFHRMDFVYLGMVGGLGAGVVLYPFRPKPKKA